MKAVLQELIPDIIKQTTAARATERYNLKHMDQRKGHRSILDVIDNSTAIQSCPRFLGKAPLGKPTTGVVKDFNPRKLFGYITEDVTGDLCYVHAQSVSYVSFRCLVPDSRVAFEKTFVYLFCIFVVFFCFFLFLVACLQFGIFVCFLIVFCIFCPYINIIKQTIYRRKPSRIGNARALNVTSIEFSFVQSPIQFKGFNACLNGNCKHMQNSTYIINKESMELRSIWMDAPG